MLARYFLCVALIFAAVLSMVQPAQASGVVTVAPSASVGNYASSFCTAGVPVLYGTASGICSAYNALNTGFTCNGNSGSTFYMSWGGNCSGIYNGSGYCADGSVAVGGLCATVCPANSTGTTTCTCTDPYIPNAGATACVEAAPPPPSECTVYPVSTYVQSMSGAGDQPLQACMQNCIFDTGSGMSWGTAGNRQWASSGRSTGTFCATNTAAASSANDLACPAGQSLNASGVCAPLAMCPYDPTIYAINVNCHPALCASDVSLYASSPLCPVPPASAVPVVVDCSVTPDDPICAGAASGTAPTITGTPGTSGVFQAPTMAPLGISGGTQNGDVTIENCMMTSGGGVVCVGDTGGVELDAVADSVPLGDKSVNIGTISPVLVGSSGGCPAPSPMILHGHTYYFDWTTYCNFAAWIKPLLLAFSWLAAAGILVGGFVA